MLLKIMPGLFAAISLTFPAGLIVYFLTSNLYRIAQNAYITRRFFRADRAIAAAAAGNGSAPPPVKAKPETTKDKAAPTPKPAPTPRPRPTPKPSGDGGTAKGTPARGPAARPPAPRLPLPTRRRSAAPHRRASSNANGTEPMA
jgi:protein TonB